MELARDPSLADRIEKSIRIVSDFPRPNVRFRDLSPIVEADPALFAAIIDAMVAQHRAQPPDCIVGIESWGYVFAAPLAYRLGRRLCLARRRGKLPRATIRQAYDMCYAECMTLEIHRDAIKAGENVLVIDDVIASGGSALAAISLIEQAGATCFGVTCVAAFADGRFTKAIEQKGIPIRALAKL